VRRAYPGPMGVSPTLIILLPPLAGGREEEEEDGADEAKSS
jgi:hypothetical protein